MGQQAAKTVALVGCLNVFPNRLGVEIITSLGAELQPFFTSTSCFFTA